MVCRDGRIFFCFHQLEIIDYKHRNTLEYFSHNISKLAYPVYYVTIIFKLSNELLKYRV